MITPKERAEIADMQEKVHSGELFSWHLWAYAVGLSEKELRRRQVLINRYELATDLDRLAVKLMKAGYIVASPITYDREENNE